MSGHSKWHNIQVRKGKQDARRGKIFTKLSKAITLAARGGSDPETNFELRIAIDAARAANVPKDNIDRAVKRGTGEDKDAAEIVSVFYEGYGPGGVAVLVECLTDNTNRTVSEVKHIFSKYGGSMGTTGSVQWQFEHLGVIRIDSVQQAKIHDWDVFELDLIEAGAKDIVPSEHGIEIVAQKEQFHRVLSVVRDVGVSEPASARLEWVAKDCIELDADTSAKMGTLYDKFDEFDDVQEIYTNEC